MKIAMIGHKRIPSREGGVEIVVEELSMRMVEKGNSVTAYNRKGDHVSGKNIDIEAHELNEYKGIKIVHVLTSRKKSLNALIYSFLASFMATFCKYDIYHYHAEGPAVMLLIPHFFRKKVVVTIHGLDWQRAKWGGFATKYLMLGERVAARYANQIIVLSRNVQEYFLKTYGRATIYIPNGVTIPERRNAEIIVDKYGLKENDYILFLARIVPEKGLHYLIKAYRELDTNKKLVIAGGKSHSDEYMNEIQEMVREDSRIVMTGFVQGKELEELYSNCFVYVLPSDIEGMPLSLLEAMSYGNRCLVSNIPENIEVIGNQGTIFQKGNIRDLREKLFELLNDECMDEVHRQDIIMYMKKNYSWEKSVDKTLQVYKEIL